MRGGRCFGRHQDCEQQELQPLKQEMEERFMQEGVEGLLRDKTRKPGKPPLPPETVQRVVDLALGPSPGETTHWTGRMLAKAAGVT
jgi:Homeodomain-like domain